VWLKKRGDENCSGDKMMLRRGAEKNVSAIIRTLRPRMIKEAIEMIKHHA
jgi:hypothetical protein